MTTLIRTAALIASIAIGGLVTVGPLALGDAPTLVRSDVHQLPRVVVTGQVTRSATASAVVQLPRVVVTGRRLAAPDTALAQSDRNPAAGS